MTQLKNLQWGIEHLQLALQKKRSNSNMIFWTLCNLVSAHLYSLIADHSPHCPHSSLHPLMSI